MTNTNMTQLLIAKPGGSVTDSEKDLIFTSNRYCLKETLSGLADTDDTGYLQIIHNLSYIPSFTVFVADYNDQTVWYSYDRFTVHNEPAGHGDPPQLEIYCLVKSKVYYALFSTPL